MKRIIITESQVKLLKKYLNEAPVPEDDFAQEVGEEFTRSLSTIQVGFKLVLFFGTENEDGSWNEDNLTVVSFIVQSIDNETGELVLTLDDVRGAQVNSFSKMDEDQKYVVSPRDSFIFNGGTPQIKIGLESKKGTRDYATIQSFLQFEVTKPELDTDSIIDMTQKKWESIRKELMTKSEFEPSWFGMDNAFFYPKGFKAMQDIADKYNASSKVETSNVEPIKFTIMANDIGGTSKYEGRPIGRIPVGSKVVGQFDSKNNTISIDDEKDDTKYVINFNSGDKVSAGAEYFVTVDVSYKDKVVVKKQETRIKITKFPKRK